MRNMVKRDKRLQQLSRRRPATDPKRASSNASQIRPNALLRILLDLAPSMRKPLLRTDGRTLAMIALFGFCTTATAQERCPELTRLHLEAEEALKKAAGLVAQDRCDAYIRFSVTWAEIAKYARDHSELCDISVSSLSDIDKRHHDAVQERENVCGGRRRNTVLPEHRQYTFPPEIRPRW